MMRNSYVFVCVRVQGMREDPAYGFVDNTGGGWDGAAADMYAFRVVPSQPNLHGVAYASHDLRLG
jgi:MADS-box transcription factor, plant